MTNLATSQLVNNEHIQAQKQRVLSKAHIRFIGTTHHSGDGHHGFSLRNEKYHSCCLGSLVDTKGLYTSFASALGQRCERKHLRAS